MNGTGNPVQIQKFLGDVDYPARKEDIVKAAQDAGADDTVRQALSKLPEGDYDAPTDVSEALADQT